MFELLSECKVVRLMPLVMDNAIARIVANNLVEASRNFLAIGSMLMRSLCRVVLSLHVTLQFLLSFQSAALRVNLLVVFKLLIRIHPIFRMFFHL